MKSIGGLMFIFGIGSFILDLLNMQFMLLSWTGNWGPNVEWGIRIGLIVVGGALWLLGRKQEAAAG